jgi:hypothetical protein
MKKTTQKITRLRLLKKQMVYNIMKSDKLSAKVSKIKVEAIEILESIPAGDKRLYHDKLKKLSTW